MHDSAIWPPRASARTESSRGWRAVRYVLDAVALLNRMTSLDVFSSGLLFRCADGTVCARGLHVRYNEDVCDASLGAYAWQGACPLPLFER